MSRFQARGTWQQGIRRSGWTFADQGLSSITNMGLSIMVARAVPIDEFGAFAIAFAVYLIALGVSRALATDAMGVRFSAAPNAEWRLAARDSTGTAVAFAIAAAAALGVAAWATTGSLRPNLLAMAVVIPGLLLQDAWRFVFFAGGRPHHAALNDAVWAGTLAALFTALWQLDAAAGWVFIGAWGIAASAAGAVGIWQAGATPRLKHARNWLGDHRDLWPSFLGEFGIQSGVSQAITFGVASIAGLSAAGALRGAQVIFGPVNVILMAAVALAVPEGARLLRHSSRAFLAAMATVSATVAASAFTWGMLAWTWLPDSVGADLLGDTWSDAEAVLLPLAFLMTASGATTGAMAGLRVMQRPGRSLAIRAVIAPASLTGGLAGAATAGATGAVWGMTAPLTLGAALWWISLLRTTKRLEHRSGIGTAPSDNGKCASRTVGRRCDGMKTIEAGCQE